jgi:phospho-N-acetylmuramoyl-pentapeptide-transferase
MTPFLVAFGGVVLAVYALLPILRGARQEINPDAPDRHAAKSGTPTMGGLGILMGAALGVGAGLVFWRPDWAAAALCPEFAALCLMTLGFALVGIVDDAISLRRGRSLGFRARYKLALQLLIAAVFIGYLSSLHLTYHSWFLDRLPPPIGIPLAVLFIVGMSNAFNLADGLDGLCAGMSTLSFLAPTVVAVLVAMPILGPEFETAGRVDPTLVLSLAFAGACVGFLVYNAHPARVFMGDTGSLPLGAAYAGVALLSGNDVVLLLCSGMFLVEAASVILQVISYKLTRRRIFKMSPLHHHFELSGWSEQQTVVRFWILQAVMIIVVLCITFQWWQAPIGTMAP